MTAHSASFVPPDPSVLRGAVRLAVLAPSIHNSQPWRWRIGATRLDLFADRTRELEVIDPGGRGLRVSCGAALLQARLALEAAGYPPAVTRMPDPTDRDHLARLELTRTLPPTADVHRLVDAAGRRRTDRRPFADQDIDVETAEALRAAAESAGAMLRHLSRVDERLDLIVAVGRADELEAADPAYVAEMRSWTGRADTAFEGVPASAVPHLPSRQSDVQLRNFEVGATGTLEAPDPTHVEHAAMFVLATVSDSDTDQLRAGEALGHVLLTATSLGLAVSPATQPIELPETRALLARTIGGFGTPQVVLRIGWPGAGAPPPPTPRRPLDDVIDVA
jgi:nitroreductase